MVVAGGLSTLIITEAGRLYASGSNHFGQLGLGHNKDQNRWVRLGAFNNVRAVATSGQTLVVTEDGELFGTGRNYEDQLGIYSDRESDDEKDKNTWFKLVDKKNIRDVACGSEHSLFLTDDGEIWGCGRNNHGQLGLGKNRVFLGTWTKLIDRSDICAIGDELKMSGIVEFCNKVGRYFNVSFLENLQDSWGCLVM